MLGVCDQQESPEQAVQAFLERYFATSVSRARSGGACRSSVLSTPCTRQPRTG